MASLNYNATASRIEALAGAMVAHDRSKLPSLAALRARGASLNCCVRWSRAAGSRDPRRGPRLVPGVVGLLHHAVRNPRRAARDAPDARGGDQGADKKAAAQALAAAGGAGGLDLPRDLLRA